MTLTKRPLVAKNLATKFVEKSCHLVNLDLYQIFDTAKHCIQPLSWVVKNLPFDTKIGPFDTVSNC